MAQPKEVRRYRAGQRPTWDKIDKDEGQNEKIKLIQPQKESLEVKFDSRLSRLEKSQEDNQSERLNRHRRIIEEAAIVEEATPAQTTNNNALNTFYEEMEKEFNLENRRERARHQHQADEELPVEENDDDADDEDTSGEESAGPEDWDQFMPSSRPKIQPKFVLKGKRQTIVERDAMKTEEMKMKEEKEKQMQQRRERTKQILVESIEREKVAKNTDNGEEVAITDDEDDEETQMKEYELWKRRELMRIRRENEEREKFRIERLDVERRRKMTDEEVAAEKRKTGEGIKEKKTMRFLQKYYHKGAFYSDDAKTVASSQDWTAATGEDKWIDRTLLPKVMQVKNFGRAGRTKYTHLKNEDTWKGDDAWVNATWNPANASKMAGTGGFDRPSRKRKMETNVNISLI